MCFSNTILSLSTDFPTFRTDLEEEVLFKAGLALELHKLWVGIAQDVGQPPLLHPAHTQGRVRPALCFDQLQSNEN